VSLGCPGYTEEMGPRAPEGLWAPPAKWDLKVLKGPRAKRVPRPLRKTGNNVRGAILVMEETMD